MGQAVQKQPPATGRRRLTTVEVAERYRTSASTIRYWRHIGYLPAGTRYGKRVLYRPEDLDAWDREREAEDAPARGGAA
jgi:predicted site-specific integrase-resolvase